MVKMERDLYQEMVKGDVLFRYLARAAKRIDVQRNGCWTWNGHLKGRKLNGKDRRTPHISGDSSKRHGVKKFNLAVRRLLLMSACGTGLDGFRVSKSCCENHRCVRPLHWIGGQRKEAWINRLLGEADERWRMVLDLDLKAMPTREVEDVLRGMLGGGLLAEKARVNGKAA